MNNLAAFSKLSLLKASMLGSALVTLSSAALWASITTPQPTQDIRAMYFRAGDMKEAQIKCGEIKARGWKIATSNALGCLGIKKSASQEEASCAIVGVDAFGSTYFKHIGDMSSLCPWNMVGSQQKIAAGHLSHQHAAITVAGGRAAQDFSWSSDEQGAPWASNL